MNGKKLLGLILIFAMFFCMEALAGTGMVVDDMEGDIECWFYGGSTTPITTVPASSTAGRMSNLYSYDGDYSLEYDLPWAETYDSTSFGMYYEDPIGVKDWSGFSNLRIRFFYTGNGPNTLNLELKMRPNWGSPYLSGNRDIYKDQWTTVDWDISGLTSWNMAIMAYLDLMFYPPGDPNYDAKLYIDSIELVDGDFVVDVNIITEPNTLPVTTTNPEVGAQTLTGDGGLFEISADANNLPVCPDVYKFDSWNVGKFFVEDMEQGTGQWWDPEHWTDPNVPDKLSQSDKYAYKGNYSLRYDYPWGNEGDMAHTLWYFVNGLEPSGTYKDWTDYDSISLSFFYTSEEDSGVPPTFNIWLIIRPLTGNTSNSGARPIYRDRWTTIVWDISDIVDPNDLDDVAWLDVYFYCISNSSANIYMDDFTLMKGKTSHTYNSNPARVFLDFNDVDITAAYEGSRECGDECHPLLPSSYDLSGDCKVDLEDIAVLGQGWPVTYDIYDLDAIAGYWLECTAPECDNW